MDTASATPQTIPHGALVGKITHYFDKIGVAVIALERPLRAGDRVVISGHGHEFEQLVDSLQYEHGQVDAAKKGSSIGVKVAEPVKKGDSVFLKA